MDKTKLSSFIEEEVKNSQDNLPKHIIFLHDPYGLAEDLTEGSMKIFNENYQIVKYVSDFHLRAKVEKYKDDDSKNFCIVSQKKDNSSIQDYTGWRSNSVLLTPQKLLEQRTGMQWCESINLVGSHLARHEREIIDWREKVGKSTILPSDAKAIVVSALANTNFIEEQSPRDVYLFLYPENKYEKLTESISDLEDYIKGRLRYALPFIIPLLDNKELYRSFPDYLWLSYIIHKLGRDPYEYMRGISSELYDRFERLKIRQEALLDLAESLQQADPAMCKKQVSAMEERVLNARQGARTHFMKLVEPQPHDPLAYYSQFVERDRYTNVTLENIFENLPNYVVGNPSSATDEKLTQIIKDLQMHWFIENYQDHMQLLIDLQTFYRHHQQIKDKPSKELSTHNQWITTYTQQIVPFESAYSNIEVNPQIRTISPENRGKIRKDYETTIWDYNVRFQRFITKNYPKWIKAWDRPLLTADFLEKVFRPHDPLRKYRYTYIIVIDCMRVDIWNQLKRNLLDHFEVLDEKFLFSLIPSSTVFSRTSIFSGKLAKESIIIPERGAPQFRFGDEKRTLAQALHIPSDNIEFISQTESVIKVDEIDHVLNSPKKLKVLVLDSVDNKIHRAGADDRLENLKQDFLDIYRTVIESILNQLGQREDTILFITSDHGFVNTNKVIMLEPEKGFIHARYADLDPESSINDQWTTVIPAGELGVTDNSSPKRYAFPLGNLSFKLARIGVTIRTRVRDEVTYGHGGLTLQEMIVPCAVVIPRRERTLKPISIKLKGYECMEEKESNVVFEVTNPNYIPMSQVSIRCNIAPPLFLFTIDANSSKEFKLSFIPKKEGDMTIELLVNYKLRDTFQESSYKEIVVVKKNPEIVRRYIDEELDKLVE
jgi:hypothetical protein